MLTLINFYIMGNNKDEARKLDYQQRVKSVIKSLKKQSPPLTAQQEKFCNEECVERFLKANADGVKKASKQLSNCLSWRDSFGTDNLVADEFCADLAEGVAYVAGHDDELRPVMIFRIKQDYQKHHSQKMINRLLVFTLEVAVQTMAKNVHQFVLLFDASLFRSASALINMLLATLKIIADNYPQRLHKAFVIDPPSLFSYLWKGVRPFVELSPLTTVVSSFDLDEPLQFNNFMMTSSNPRATSSSAKIGSCSSSRFSFTVSHHFDTLKPWYLSLTDASESKLGRANNARSHSFSSTPIMTQKTTPKTDPSTATRNPRTPRPWFLHSPAVFFRKDCRADQKYTHESFVPFLRFYRQPYDEMVYRSKMRPPLGGLVSVVSPQLKRRHISRSQRF